jgi:hypothetical protein
MAQGHSSLDRVNRISSDSVWPLRGQDGKTFAERCPEGQTYAQRRDALLKRKGLEQ